MIFFPNYQVFINKRNMKNFIRQRLREDLIYNHVVGDATNDEYQITEDDLNRISDIKNELNSLPQTLTLYRVVYVDDEGQINQIEVGSHYVLKRRELESSHYQGSHVGGGSPLILTVKADKSLIDVQTTINNRVKYPHEKEVTLKNKGVGAKIIKVEPFESSDEDLIGSPEDFDLDFY